MKKLLALLMAVVMCLGLFAACTPADDKDATEAPTDSIVTEAPEAEGEGEAAEGEADATDAVEGEGEAAEGEAESAETEAPAENG